ncbi:MAG: NAD-dependent epimerase/dehydratase family protein [Planctomycetota bacterium]|nr:NAD-dependent epimerase/dehydratase family protein [Planctomycetota bacterium]
MRILVTGGAGFIGSHIVDQLLADQHEIAVLDNLSTGFRHNVPIDVRFEQADVRDRDAVRRVFADFRPDAICHQAAQMSVSRSVREPSHDADVNVMGLLNVLEQSVAVGVKRFVFASSGGVLYGDVFAPADESHPAQPISPYGISKWVGEQYLQFFAREHGLQTVALRYANVFGPRQNPHGEAGVVAIFCQRMLRREETTINGDGKFDRDYVFVTDVAQANVMALQHNPTATFDAFNVGTAIATDVNVLASELHRTCTAILGRTDATVTIPQPVHGPDRPGDLRSSIVSFGKINTKLGWKPEMQITEGLVETVEWFRIQTDSNH